MLPGTREDLVQAYSLQVGIRKLAPVSEHADGYVNLEMYPQVTPNIDLLSLLCPSPNVGRI